MKLAVLPGRFAVARPEPAAPIPAWATGGTLCSVTRNAEELSVVCAAGHEVHENQAGATRRAPLALGEARPQLPRRRRGSLSLTPPPSMRITARVTNREGQVATQVATDGNAHSIVLDAKPSGLGARANGGELLMLALATCFCNDLHREAARRELALRSVEVEVSGQFGGRGDPGTGLTYAARVDADATPEEIADLIRETDRVAEIHNTLRRGTEVTLVPGSTAGS